MFNQRARRPGTRRTWHRIRLVPASCHSKKAWTHFNVSICLTYSSTISCVQSDKRAIRRSASRAQRFTQKVLEHLILPILLRMRVNRCSSPTASICHSLPIQSTWIACLRRCRARNSSGAQVTTSPSLSRLVASEEPYSLNRLRTKMMPNASTRHRSKSPSADIKSLRGCHSIHSTR